MAYIRILPEALDLTGEVNSVLVTSRSLGGENAIDAGGNDGISYMLVDNRCS